METNNSFNNNTNSQATGRPIRQYQYRTTETIPGEKPYKCKTCGKSFHFSSSLAEHEFRHTGEKPFACEICDYKGPTKGALSQHQVVHSGEKPFECSICIMKFARKGALKTHLATHTNHMEFQSEQIPLSKESESSSEQTSERQNISQPSEEKLSCKHCRKTFSSFRRLWIHEKHHSGDNTQPSTNLETNLAEMPFQCTVCGNRFKNSGGLELHGFLHTTAPPFDCMVCGQVYNNADDLEQHIPTHNECDKCGRRFFTRAKLGKHVCSTDLPVN